MANKANATKAPSAAEIEAFMKAQAATKAAETPETSKPEKADEIDYKALGASMLNHVCKVTAGSKHKNELVKVFFVSKGRPANGEYKAKRPVARIELADGTIDFMGLRNMEIVGPMEQADIDRLTAAQKAQNEETLYIAATCRSVGEKAIQLDTSGWWKPIWFPKEACARMNATVKVGDTTLDIYEVPAWKIRQQAGNDSYEVAKAKQVELEKLVNSAAS